MPPRFLYNDPSFKRRRQKRRNDSTLAERKLWRHLRGKQLLDVKFQRQFGVGPYVLDFFCPELRLAIEVDGPSHFTPEAKAYDSKRQRYVEGHDITLIRFTNADVLENTEGVLEEIVRTVGRLPQNRNITPCSPPKIGGETY